MSQQFSQVQCPYHEPEELPWSGIYHPRSSQPFTDVRTYCQQFCVAGRPTIAMIFAREEWIWGNVAYQMEMIKEIEEQGYNALVVFTNNLANPHTTAPTLAETFETYFYDQGKVIIDVLINTFELWKNGFEGMSPSEISYGIALPEFDGIIHSVPVSTREELADGSHEKKPIMERIAMLVRKADKWGRLRHKDNREKKVGIIFHNYPPTNSNIGSASCLDSLESVRLLLAAMIEQGYQVDHLPENSQVFNYDGALLIPGMLNGNVFITVQPPRGFGEDPGKIYHSPDCAPTHHYLGFYYWLRNIWQADVLIHPYWITCIGEGIQAKRRSAACLISYLSAPMSVSGTYDELAELEKLLEEYCHFKQET